MVWLSGQETRYFGTDDRSGHACERAPAMCGQGADVAVAGLNQSAKAPLQPPNVTGDAGRAAVFQSITGTRRALATKPAQIAIRPAHDCARDRPQDRVGLSKKTSVRTMSPGLLKSPEPRSPMSLDDLTDGAVRDDRPPRRIAGMSLRKPISAPPSKTHARREHRRTGSAYFAPKIDLAAMSVRKHAKKRSKMAVGTCATRRAPKPR